MSFDQGCEYQMDALRGRTADGGYQSAGGKDAFMECHIYVLREMLIMRRCFEDYITENYYLFVNASSSEGIPVPDHGSVFRGHTVSSRYGCRRDRRNTLMASMASLLRARMSRTGGTGGPGSRGSPAGWTGSAI